MSNHAVKLVIMHGERWVCGHEGIKRRVSYDNNLPQDSHFHAVESRHIVCSAPIALLDSKPLSCIGKEHNYGWLKIKNHTPQS